MFVDNVVQRKLSNVSLPYLPLYQDFTGVGVSKQAGRLVISGDCLGFSTSGGQTLEKWKHPLVETRIADAQQPLFNWVRSLGRSLRTLYEDRGTWCQLQAELFNHELS